MHTVTSRRRRCALVGHLLLILLWLLLSLVLVVCHGGVPLWLPLKVLF